MRSGRAGLEQREIKAKLVKSLKSEVLNSKLFISE